MWQWETIETIPRRCPPRGSSSIIFIYEARQSASKWVERRSSEQP